MSREDLAEQSKNYKSGVPALPDTPLISRDLIREIAMDIGKEIASHIEIMYPGAVGATTPNMLISVRNCVHNEIMAALDVVDEDEIRERLKRRKAERRAARAVWRIIRGGTP